MSKQLTIDDISLRSERLFDPDEIFRLADGPLLHSLRESSKIERKTASFTGEDLGDYICMWANTPPYGGLIVSGQNNDGSFEGCLKLSQNQVNKLEKCGSVFCPDAKVVTRHIEVINASGIPDFVLLTRVFYHHTLVVKTTCGKVFRRIGDEIHTVVGDHIRELEAEKGIVSFETQDSNLKWPVDFSYPDVKSFVNAARTAMNYAPRFNDMDILEFRHLGRKDGENFIPNYACCLLFAKDVRSILPGARVHFKRFEDIREKTGKQYNPIKEEMVEGTIPQIFEKVTELLDSQLRVFRPLTESGKFFPVPEYPKEAWMEAVVNACVHRSYGNGMKNIPIYIRMYDDRLEVESPGPFMPMVNPTNIYQTHCPRNPHLMDALRLLDYTRMSREGCQRIKETMVNSSLPEPVFEQDNSHNLVVRVTLQNLVKQRRAWIDNDVSKILSDVIAESLDDDEKQIINYVAEKTTISVVDASRLIKSTWDTAYNILLGIVKKGIFQYIRYRPNMINVRDSKAYFRLKSKAPIPAGAYIVTDLEKQPSDHPGGDSPATRS